MYNHKMPLSAKPVSGTRTEIRIPNTRLEFKKRPIKTMSHEITEERTERALFREFIMNVPRSDHSFYSDVVTVIRPA
jgi:hypothetical protein